MRGTLEFLYSFQVLYIPETVWQCSSTAATCRVGDLRSERFRNGKSSTGFKRTSHTERQPVTVTLQPQLESTQSICEC